ncbi:hypothetical protein [Mangrovibacillus cuniculi]|uniref:SGNH hydrolase-type esterase domain-containing protein n=1 Tax=Mangrovibacillus cuniculi TaxID=2593652 RepID=A0A7S8CCW8_9BACI|nr:hypothetical protein [Mangrovibacillus cuniculi]QPC47592.1 hypothetical protein G8O30_11830 [Mangrovibacillus cuniculi]
MKLYSKWSILGILFILLIGVGTYKITDRAEATKPNFPGIVVWGDSLTKGAGGKGTNYPGVLQRLLQEQGVNVPVVNMGVSGEDTNTIIGRAGGVPFSLVNNTTIPSTSIPVNITLQSENGHEVIPFRRGDRGINPVTINGIEGKISWDKEKDAYSFQRSQTGRTTTIADGSTIVTNATNQYEGFVPVVFIGQNGGYETPEELVSHVDSIIHMEKYDEKFLVLGLTSGTKESRAELEKVMEETYGIQYINLREYLSNVNLGRVNIKATKADKDAIASGSVPPSLLVDYVHFNQVGYELIGEAVFERMMELGWVE